MALPVITGTTAGALPALTRKVTTAVPVAAGCTGLPLEEDVFAGQVTVIVAW